MTDRLYTGPFQSFEARVAGELVPVTCVPGEPFTLPDDHEVTIAFVAAGFVPPPEPVADEAPIADAVEASAGAPVTDPAAAIEPQATPDPIPAEPAGEPQE